MSPVLIISSVLLKPFGVDVAEESRKVDRMNLWLFDLSGTVFH